MTTTALRLPQGHALTAEHFAWRHRFVCAVLAVHLPVLLGMALASGRDLPHALLETSPAAALLGLALLVRPQRGRALSASLGLLASTALLVHLSDAPGVHFHSFVVVAVVALYQDWLLLLLAAACVLVRDGLAAPGAWDAAVLHASLLVAQSAVLLVFWEADERARADEAQMRSELAEGRSTVQARIAETDRIRTDLIGTVSHEFRTPLTGIRGAALTLLKRGGRLAEADRESLLRAVLEQQERLSRLLENMLVAAQATAADPGACAEVDAVAAEVAMLAGAARPQCAAVSVAVEPGLEAHIDRQALHQVLANLVDNAQQHGVCSSVPILAGGRDALGVWVSVSNEGDPLPEHQLSRLFEPFTQVDGSPTRGQEGLGLGLYVVRRLVEVYGGDVRARSEAGWTTVEVRLQPARPREVVLPRVDALARGARLSA